MCVFVVVSQKLFSIFIIVASLVLLLQLILLLVDNLNVMADVFVHVYLCSTSHTLRHLLREMHDLWFSIIAVTQRSLDHHHMWCMFIWHLLHVPGSDDLISLLLVNEYIGGK